MLFLDSALINEAETALHMGWTKGITTNPILLKKSPFPPEETLKALAQFPLQELYYQLISTTLEGMIKEAYKAREIIGEKLVLKIPATFLGFQAVSRLSPEITCSVTAIYHPSQALLARETGAKYAIAYVHRATKLLGNGYHLVTSMAEVLAESQTEILSASIKSADEAVSSLVAGSHHLTLPLALLQAMAVNSFSEQTMVDFNREGIGLS